MNALQIAALIYSLGTSSVPDDARTVISHPSPANVVQLAADAAGVMPTPHAKLIALGLATFALMLRHPSQNPMADARTARDPHTGRNFR